MRNAAFLKKGLAKNFTILTHKAGACDKQAPAFLVEKIHEKWYSRNYKSMDVRKLYRYERKNTSLPA